MGILIRKLQGFDDEFQRILDEATEKVANEFLEFLKESIENGSLDLEPLTEAYLRHKIAKGLDERILIATREYLDKLKVVKTPEGVFVGARPGETHEASGVDMASLAMWLEYGTQNLPARPHFGPAWDMFWPEAQKRLLKLIQDEIDEYWR